MTVKVYYQITDQEESFIFCSKEFGTLEYFDENTCLMSKGMRELISDTYIPKKGQKITNIKEVEESGYGKIIYLGEL